MTDISADNASRIAEGLHSHNAADYPNTLEEFATEGHDVIYALRAHIDTQAAKIEEQAERIEELEAACEVVSNEFEGELWQSCRRLLQETYFDFSGTRGDGIQAADFESHMKETLSEFDRLQVKSDAQAATIKALVEALEMVSGIIPAGDDPDGSGFFDIKHKEIEQVFSAIAAAKETT